MSLVTIIIPCAPGHKDLVHEAVESVKQQTILCECIVVEDKKRRGAGWARNKGLAQVKTPFVAFLDADDLLLPEFAERCLKAWRPNTYVFTWWYQNGVVHPLPDGLTIIDHTVTCFMSTDMALNAGGFDEELPGAEDTEFYVRLLSRGVKRVQVAAPLMHYRPLGQRSDALIESGLYDDVMSTIGERYGKDRVFLPQRVPHGAKELALAMQGQMIAGRPWVTPDGALDTSQNWKPTRVEPPYPGNKPERRAAYDISVIVPTHNRIGYLQNMIRSARAAMPDDVSYEFVVVDGGSTDGTLAWCVAEPDVTLVEHGALLGTVKAFSDGAREARGQYVLQCNDDSEFLPGSIERAYQWMQHRPTCGCVAFAYDLPHHPNRFTVGQHIFMAQNGQELRVNFANEGLYRRWLLEAGGWFGDGDEAFGARSYGSDSYASVKVWEQGYSVDFVIGACLHDRDARDEKKRINQYPPTNANPDTRKFMKRFPFGPSIPLAPCSEPTR